MFSDEVSLERAQLANGSVRHLEAWTSVMAYGVGPILCLCLQNFRGYASAQTDDGKLALTHARSSLLSCLTVQMARRTNSFLGCLYGVALIWLIRALDVVFDQKEPPNDAVLMCFINIPLGGLII